jgi:hypothetical protein
VSTLLLLTAMVLLLALAAPATADAAERSSLLGINSWALLEEEPQLSPLRDMPIGTELRNRSERQIERQLVPALAGTFRGTGAG